MEKKNKLLLLLIGTLLIFFSNGKWMVPYSIWIVLFSFLRFSRYNKLISGFSIILIISFISNIIVMKGWLPLPSPLYYIVCFISGIFFSIPFLIDRVLVKEKSRFIDTLFFPSSLTFFSYIFSIINPSGTLFSLAYTQTNIVLLQIVSVTGIWGIIFILGWTASIINYIIDNYKIKQRIKFAVTTYLITAAIILIYGIGRINFSKPGETVKIAGIIHEHRFNKQINDHIEEFIVSSNKDLDSLLLETNRCIKKGAKIIFWQEAAHLVLDRYEDSLVNKAIKISKNNNIYLGLSIFTLSKEYPSIPAENKIIWVTPSAEIGMEFLKLHPTPAEIVVKGNEKPEVLSTPFGKLSSAICFDLNFPDFIRNYGRKQVDILCVPANDWKEITPYHANISAFRAIENGINIFRTTGNGLSVAYDYNGKILAKLNYFDSNKRVLYADVPVHRMPSIYPMLGDFLPWLSILFLLVITAVKVIKKE